ncbi:MAG: response regulator [Anaerolineae bacterium]|nr:response regulator [Anaerolineae bacterium]
MATILITEDDRIALRAITFILTHVGHRVLTAIDGYTALEQLAETDADLLILDMAMPGMDGLTLLQRLRTESRLATLPVMVLTASAEDNLLEQARQAGAQKIVSKPAASQHLLETIAELLQN